MKQSKPKPVGKHPHKGKSKGPSKAKPASSPPEAPPENVATPTTPVPDKLHIAVDYDRQQRGYFWSLREGKGKVEHLACPQAFASEEKARAAGEKWLAKYAKARSDVQRRKMLGWKPLLQEGDPTASSASPVTEPSESPKNSGDSPGNNATPGTSAKLRADGTPRSPSGLDVAAQILRAAGQPMNCKALVETMLTKGLWKTTGKTPAATIAAAIFREIQTKGDQARFQKVGRGLFTHRNPT